MADSIIDNRLNLAVDEIGQILALTDQAIQEQTRERVSAVAAASEAARKSALLLLGGAGILAVLIGLWLTQSISSPIDELESGMRAVAEGDFGHPLNIGASRRDEFGRLAGSYNSMATQLRELDRLKAEFISVASHELKTPINVITRVPPAAARERLRPLSEQQTEIVRRSSPGAVALHASSASSSTSAASRQAADARSATHVPFPPFSTISSGRFRVLALQREVSFA